MSKKTKYPLYVISKGRYETTYTADFLTKDGVTDFKLVVEPQEAALYKAKYPNNVVVLPFSNLGKGSIPARNWCWEDSIKNGYERHWMIDDNIRAIGRWNKGKRLVCNAKFAFNAVETFADRYKNLAVAGLDYEMFCVGEMTKPFILNCRVYSCMLIDNSVSIRWRGRYNEDTDLCLQALASNYCTALFRAFFTRKTRTMTLKGGNTDILYKGDGRAKMSRSLERVWPYVTETKRRFDRPQHKVRDNWRKFDTKLIFKDDVDLSAMPKVNEMGMKLKQVKEIQSPSLKKFFEENS